MNDPLTPLVPFLRAWACLAYSALALLALALILNRWRHNVRENQHRMNRALALHVRSREEKP
jgi:hypothetical protein